MILNKGAIIPMTSVFDIAKYILEKYESLPNMKLQKLVYYSQAWSLAWDNEPLFYEEIKAWANGPVVEELYELLKGKFEVNSGMIESFNTLTDEQKETIDTVCEFYGVKEPQELSDMVRQEDPWINARIGLEEYERGDRIILKEAMKEYYSNIDI